MALLGRMLQSQLAGSAEKARRLGAELVADACTSPALSPVDLMADHEWIKSFVNLLRDGLS